MNSNATPRHIHFVGIAGIGMSALAQISSSRGIRVSGSDPHADAADNHAMDRLRARGATLFTEHCAENIGADVDLVVATAAVSEQNPEVQAAIQRGIRITSRADYLGELMAAHRGIKIAIAGTHGKTTTTGMLGVILERAGLDPTVFVGGEVAELGGNVRIGSPEGPFVAEACEAYDSFLSLAPDIAVVTNIEPDHLDHYIDFEGVKSAFTAFLSHVPTGGHVVYSADDADSIEVAGPFGSRINLETFTLEGAVIGQDAAKIKGAPAFRASAVSESGRTCFLLSRGDESVAVELSVPGRHNVANAAAAAAAARLVAVDMEQIAHGLAAFRGATRRQEILGCVDDVLIMDDYAHHPTEIRATLSALRSGYPKRRLIAVFQPHLYSRTRDFLQEFGEKLAAADVLIVTDIYAAREVSIPGVDASDIARIARESKPRESESVQDFSAAYVQDRNAVPAYLSKLARPGDLAVFLGAGDIREQAESFLSILKGRSGTL